MDPEEAAKIIADELNVKRVSLVVCNTEKGTLFTVWDGPLNRFGFTFADSSVLEGSDKLAREVWAMVFSKQQKNVPHEHD